jgi:hypothetical protein
MKNKGLFLFQLMGACLLLGLASGIATAQSVPAGGDDSVYFVSYFSNNVAAAPDAVARFINDGDAQQIEESQVTQNQPQLTLWADFYVFDDSEELTECCACEVSPDGLLSEDVKTQLTANPLTGKVPTRGVIKVISSLSSDPTNILPTTGLRGWLTHIQSVTKSTYAITESRFANANLSGAEFQLLQNLCYFDGLLSGLPCTCTPEDHDF